MEGCIEASPHWISWVKEMRCGLKLRCAMTYMYLLSRTISLRDWGLNPRRCVTMEDASLIKRTELSLHLQLEFMPIHALAEQVCELTCHD